MNYIDLTQNTTGGVSDYTELENLPQINGVTLTGNKSSTDLGIFLPDGYTITVATDDSGDFTDIQSALDSLQDKVCAGTVTINIAAGTYTVSSQILIANEYNGNILIKGAGISNTIINFTNSPSWAGAIQCDMVSNTITIRDIAIINTSGTTTGKLGIASTYSNIITYNIKLQNWLDAIDIGASSTVVCRNAITIENCTVGLYAEGGGRFYIRYGATLAFTNITTALSVYSGGFISCFSVTKAFTNVTNTTNQTVGQSTTNGLICGI